MQSSGKNGGNHRADLPTDPPQVPEGRQPMDRPNAEIETEVKLDESAQALIGHHLQAVYREIVEQPIPDQFLKLLEDLERKERER